MERCTIRLKTGEARCSQLDGNVVVERLAAYEDTGLTPKEVTSLGELFDYALKESKTLTEQLTLLKHIRELAEADKDGRVVVLPCKVGDRVYIPDIESKTVANVRVQGISITPKSRVVLHFGGYPVESAWGDRCGIDWFITIEEAEKALAEMEGKA